MPQHTKSLFVANQDIEANQIASMSNRFNGICKHQICTRSGARSNKAYNSSLSETNLQTPGDKFTHIIASDVSVLIKCKANCLSVYLVSIQRSDQIAEKF